ncbi:hypothetical protein [Endozoicomonas acroporae]|uniref:hypothetical protein n=1 Tax=Endozoicomonas acroporae TaxID=1701104 RepID=UPI0013D50568|nr:hypothetical protein [Endozoicomonas acroporae]
MDNYDGAGWTDWVLLKELDRASIPDQPGVYMIAAHRRIHRAHGTDKQGILDICESDNLKKRIAAFRACSLGHRNRGHMAGWRFYNFNFDSIFPHEKLWICWKTCRRKKEAYALEGELLQAYFSKHYELPPLNYKFNWASHAAHD